MFSNQSDPRKRQKNSAESQLGPTYGISLDLSVFGKKMATKSASKITIKNIIELAELYKSGKTLNLDSWAAFHRIFRLTSATGYMKTPAEFEKKLVKWFHREDDVGPEPAIKRAKQQTVVRIFDRWVCNQTCFNTARSYKPLCTGYKGDLKRETSVCDMPVEDCDFCQPYKLTASDTFGRLENNSALTASNVAKYDALHTMIVFKEHSPSNVTEAKVLDMLNLAAQWFEIAHKEYPNFIYPNISWNCRSRAGASQHHGHAHMELAEEFHYGHWERLKQISHLYSQEYPGKNYFNDLVEAHCTLNLAQQCGSAWILIHVVPYCGYELKVICWDFNDDFKLAVSKAVHMLVVDFNSHYFNVCIQFPPLQNGKQRPSLASCPGLQKSEDKMPYIAHLVDRGDVNKGTSSDVCSMRIYGSAIVNEDPFILAQKLNWI